MSRMQADLAGSRHQSGTTTPIGNGNDNPEHPAMFRRFLTAGRKRKPHVCIVGAGVAGLRCADVLLQEGIKVTMLEARNRVGGRLCQAKVGSHLVDLGPNWIHGTVDNPILDLVRDTGTVTASFGERHATWDPKGQPVDPETRAEYMEMLWALIDEAMKYSHDHSADIPKDESLLDFIRNRIESKFTDVGEEESFKSDEIGNKELFYQMAEIWGAFIGGTTSTQSMKFMWLEQCLDGENPFVAGTYKKVLDVISGPAVDAGIIRFGQAVEKIVSKRHPESGNPQVEIRTKEGLAEIFDEIVFTAPLGWLKRNVENVFEPAIPKRISEAVRNLGYGNLDKVYITFPTAFWEQSPSNETANADSFVEQRIQQAQRDIPNVTATALPLHQPSGTAPAQPAGDNLSIRNFSRKDSSHSTSVNQILETERASSKFPGFANWIHPTYAKDTNPECWTQECMNLAALPADCAHPTLLFYTTGPTSTHIAKLILRHSASGPEAVKDALYSFFVPYISLLPNYSPTSFSCQPTDILATAWQNDEFAGYGSYTNFQVGIEAADEDLIALRKGLPERGVWLAGEHCAPFVALGTVTGAAWSGELVARRICDAWGFNVFEGPRIDTNGDEEEVD